MFGRSRGKSEWIDLERDVEVLKIPSGEETQLEEGQKVRIHQQLGDQFTLMTEWGYLVRLPVDDADAIGKTPPDERDVEEELDKPLEDRVWGAMRQCYDPEIPVNIVDLGLVYACEIKEDAGEDGGAVVEIDMTLTAPGCGMGEVIASDVNRAVESVTGVDRADINLVFDPPWDRSMMSEEAMLELGFL